MIQQEILDVAPGRYTLQVSVRDDASQRTAQEQIAIVVPRLGDGALSSPMPIAEVTPRTARDVLPLLILNPAATAVVGRDSVLPVYLEGYGDTTSAVRLLIRGERGRVMWNDTVPVLPKGTLRSGVVEVPVSRLGIGVAGGKQNFSPVGMNPTASGFANTGWSHENERTDRAIRILQPAATAADGV